MNPITQTEAGIAAGYTAAANYDKTAQNSKNTKNTKNMKETQQAYESTPARKTSKVTNGRTIGEPELSEKGQKYYDQLRKKYSNMDFILVSKDMKGYAQANAGSYANKNRMVVLIDEEKIERMAEDEKFRSQYEGIISGAATKLNQVKDSLGVNASHVKTYGMQVNDGGNASFFAVIDKSLAAQKDRITKKAQQKAAAKKKEQKAAEQKRAEERREQKIQEEKKTGKYGKAEGITDSEDEDTITVTADSVEELLRKIEDAIFAQRSQYIRSDMERQVGQKFDFAI